MSPPRLRMFAGPNGSGKSTIKTVVPAGLLGVYINPDEIEAKLARERALNLSDFGITAKAAEIERYLAQSPVMAGKFSLEGIRCQRDTIELIGKSANPYLASALSSFLREKLVEQKATFTFETVMSSRDKVELLCKAQSLGYRTYLYFIATDDPEINVERVQLRESLGGHSVAPEKIVARYHKCLALLLGAIRCSNRAYLFDNSGAAPEWIAEVTDGTGLELKVNALPLWFAQSVLNKLDPVDE